MMSQPPETREYLSTDTRMPATTPNEAHLRRHHDAQYPEAVVVGTHNTYQGQLTPPAITIPAHRADYPNPISSTCGETNANHHAQYVHGPNNGTYHQGSSYMAAMSSTIGVSEYYGVYLSRCTETILNLHDE